MAEPPVSFVAACRKFFGMQPGQTISQFAAEMKELTPEYREWFKREFAKIGVTIE